jgi:hypothetical protein
MESVLLATWKEISHLYDSTLLSVYLPLWKKLDTILKRVKGDNLIVPLFVYESIVYGDVLVSRKYQDDYDVVMIRENGVKCCDHKMQQIEFLPVSPLLGNYYPRRIPVRLESQEEAEKVIVRFFEE